MGTPTAGEQAGRAESQIQRLIEGHVLGETTYGKCSAVCRAVNRLKKGSGVFYQDPFGRPRARSVDSNPRRVAIRPCQRSLPNGCPRWTLHRSASSSAAVSG